MDEAIDINLMKPIDTLHDFWGHQRGDDIEDILNKLKYKETTLEAFIDFIKQLKPSIKVNDIENTGAAYFEDKYKKNDLLTAINDDNIITIDPTNTDDNNNNNLNNYLNNNAVQIIFPKDIDDDYNLSYLAGFIRKFMFGDATGEKKIGFVIDANHGKLPHIFKFDKKVNTVLNALVVADSANTPKEHSNSLFYDRLTPNEFPDYKGTISNIKSTGKIYHVEKSVFFSTLFDSYYQETSAGSFNDDITAFKLIVQDKKQPPAWSAEAYFSPTTTQGASVDTLKKLIQIVNNTKTNKNLTIKELLNMNYPAKQLDIRPIVQKMKMNDIDTNDIIKFLLDYKRSGDYEQINSAKKIQENKTLDQIIFSTGDQLCALYARSQGLPCIYNHAGKMDMYTFQSVKETPEQQNERLKVIYTTKLEHYSKYKSFFNIITPEEFATAIKQYLQDIAVYVKSEINPPYWIDDTMDAYIKALGNLENDYFKDLIIGNLNSIIADFEEKIANPQKVTREKEKIEKIQLFLDIIDKIVEDIQNAGEINAEEIKKKIENQSKKIYEIDNNFFNHNFDSQKLFLSLFNGFNVDAAEEKKIIAQQGDLEREQKNLATADERKKQGYEKRVNEAITKLHALRNKYESKIMTKINVMNDEIIKIYKNCDDILNAAGQPSNKVADINKKLEDFNNSIKTGDDTFKAKEVVDKYKAFIQNSLGQKQTPMSIQGGEGNEDDVKRDEDEIQYKIITGLETAIMTLIDDCEVMFKALYKEYDKQWKNDTWMGISFKLYLKHLYYELYESINKERERELKKIPENPDEPIPDGTIPDNNKIQFMIRITGIPEITAETIKADYVQYINRLISDFNTTLIENMPPTLDTSAYYERIEKILSSDVNINNVRFKKLLYKENASDDASDDVIELEKLLEMTCIERDGTIIKKFKNFDDYKYEVNTDVVVGGATPGVGRFKNSVKRLINVQRVISTLKEIRENKIAKKQEKLENVQTMWDLIRKAPSQTPPLVSPPEGEPSAKRIKSSITPPTTSVAAQKRPLSPSPTLGPEPTVKKGRKSKTPSPNAELNRRTVYGPQGQMTPEPTPAPQLRLSSKRRAKSQIGPSSIKKSRVLSPLGEGGGKRTRKNKNKRNKKTRQRHQKSRKNTTKKNRKAKGKHRTPRH